MKTSWKSWRDRSYPQILIIDKGGEIVHKVLRDNRDRKYCAEHIAVLRLAHSRKSKNYIDTNEPLKKATFGNFPLPYRQTDFIGAVGEIEFALRYGLPLIAYNDGKGAAQYGYDFVTPVGTVDVKTFKSAGHLARKVDSLKRKNIVHPDILVMAHFHRNNQADLIGWQFDAVMRRQKTRVLMTGVNHIMPTLELRQIHELEKQMRLVAFGEQKELIGD